MHPDELLQWRTLRDAGSAEARDALVSKYLPYARMLAATVYAGRYHDEIEFADYMQIASVGLMECVDRFDPELGTQFKTYASQRIKGAVLSGLERLTEKQQQVAVRQRLAKERLQSMKVASDAMTGGKAFVDDSSQLFRRLADIGIGMALSLLLDGTGMIDSVQEAGEAAGYYRDIELKQLQQRIRELVDKLPDQERTVVRYHYLQEFAFEEIARELNLSRGRISQIHGKALQRLREYIKEDNQGSAAW